MRIYLKQNWSEQFIYGDKTPGVFVGRRQEINWLKSIVLHNDSSAVLVSSIRGVGKTSFIHKVLSEIKEENNKNSCDDILLDTKIKEKKSKEKIFPIFVNIGHALANADINKNEKKKLILIPLIRATYFNNIEFKNDEKLTEIYKKCFGVYKEIESSEQRTNTKKEIEFSVKSNVKDIIRLVGTILLTSGVLLNNLWARIICGFLGISFLSLSFTWKKSWSEILLNEKSLIIDDSTEYLEIEFENWLKKQKNKDKKIIFVIDELDKIDEKKSFEVIKEYKNLFTRSFAHFIFVAGQDAFELVNNDRENSADEGGIFPTLFTHVLYLPLPKSNEIKLYLKEIFNENEDGNEEETNNLINYLLFRSGNDFFELKRRIGDLISFDEKEASFIDVEKIKESDPSFIKIPKLFGYVNKWFFERHLKELKINWKDNSQLQRDIFKFLNKNFGRNISLEVNDKNNINIKNLISFLRAIGVLDSVETNELNDIRFKWTFKYNRDVNSSLLETDNNFIKSFKNLIKVANDLDDLTEKYKENKFNNYTDIIENRDGQEFSGINLYSTFEQYIKLFDDINDPLERIAITAEKTKKADKIINEQISNVFSEYFKIFIGLLSEILSYKGSIFKDQQLNEISSVFELFPNLYQTFENYTHSIYRLEDNTRVVLILKEFADYSIINNELKSLIEQKNILIINLKKDEKYNITPIKVEINYEDKIGRKRKKKIIVDNFIDFKFNDFRQFAILFRKIKKHLMN